MILKPSNLWDGSARTMGPNKALQGSRNGGAALAVAAP
jgi:hypothetical protein